MNDEMKISVLVLGAVIIGIVIGASLAQKISGEIKDVSSGINSLETSIKGLDSSIKGVDSSVKEVKTSLAEKELQSFRRDMQENGRRMLSIDYAGKFAKWDAAKKEVDELDKTLQSSANLRSDLSPSIQSFRSTYIPKLKEAADKKDAKNFGTVWTETYNACIACHQGSRASPEAFEILREIGAEVEQLSG